MRPFLRSVPLSLSLSLFEDFGHVVIPPRLVDLGCTLNLTSLSLSVGRSSKASSSVPSPYVLWRLGRRNSLGADDDEMDGVRLWEARLRKEAVDGGRGGMGEVARYGGWGCARVLAVEGPGKTEDRAGLDFIRMEVGIVSRNAAGFDEGVDGRVGGTVNSSA